MPIRAFLAKRFRQVIAEEDTYHFCYAHGLRILDNGRILLIENFDQVDI